MAYNDLLYNAEKLYSYEYDFKPTLITRLTSSFRILPDFFIGGVQKGGTTSLYYALTHHPQIIQAKNKETYYYGTTPNYEKGLHHYRSFFATDFLKKRRESATGKTVLTLDASTNTIDSKEAALRILKDNPKAKIIFILRNPAERAYSHYKMSVKMGWELTDFEKALELEDRRIEDGKKNVLSDSKHNFAYQRLGYRSRGIYVNHLEHWFKDFPNENILVTSSENFFNDPSKVFNSICAFLGIEKDVNVHFGKMNEGSFEKINPKAHENLTAFYKPHNEALFKLLDQKFDW